MDITTINALRGSLTSVTASYAGLVSEARVFVILRTSILVVRGVESDRIDGALMLDDKLPENWPRSAISRTYLANNPNQKQIVAQLQCTPFDVKCSVVFASSRGAAWGLRCSGAQVQDSDFLIVVYGTTEEMCALIPVSDIFPPSRAMTKAEKTQFRRRWNEIEPKYYTNVPVEDAYLCGGLPPVVSPYVMPISLLPEAFREIGNARRENRKYRNPFRNVELNWIPSLSGLQSFTSSSIETSVSKLLRIQAILSKEGDRRLTMTLMDLQPYLGDFKLTLSMPGGPQTFIVEHKYANFSITSQDTVVHNCYRVHRGQKRYYFHPRVQWHFFWTEGSTSRNQDHLAYFIPVDEIPWWVTPANKHLETQSIDKSQLSAFALNFQQPGVYNKIVAILERYRNQQGPSNRDFAFRLHEIEDDTLDHEEGRALDPGDEDLDDIGTTDKGVEAQRYAFRILQPVYLHLNHQCAKKGKGLFLFLGNRHPWANFFFVRYEWTQLERETFWETGKLPLDLTSRRLCGSQAGVYILHHPVRHMATAQDPKTYLPWTLYRKHPILVLGKELREDLMNPRTNFYFIPSMFLDPGFNDYRDLGVREKPKENSGKNAVALPLTRPNGLMLQPYWRITSTELIDRLYEILDPAMTEVRLNWAGLSGNIGKRLRSTLREGLEAAASELRNYG